MTAPTKQKALGGGLDAGLRGKTLDADSVPTKEFAEVKNRFAARGHSLQRIRYPQGRFDSFLVSRWGHGRQFSSWDEVVAFLRVIGGAP
jgi:hypothetical protein